ncbi:ABC transporter substrate-binding protein [Actinomycetospora lutea]|uniref:ABC transporter substrate-binding protein n=1 Tax=Actinomycetospora lutea TaxID=663604 RepID=UPI0023667832|nr:ABC transporter substrate-binding protein [Actinomycetospora lutea]MDD7940432.1 ABC transporter substrate-binding protein [Actinomycetospora lutea]
MGSAVGRDAAAVRRPTLRALLAGLAALLVLAGCGGGGESGGGGGGGATRTVESERGPVQVPVAPQRIAVLSGGLAGDLFTLQAPVVAADPRVLGVKNDASGFPPSWSGQAQQQGTQRLASEGAGLSIEQVAAARPDLIIGGGQGFTAAQAANAYPQLQQIAPTVLLPAFTQWQDQLTRIADVVGRSDRVPGLMQAYQDRAAQVRGALRVPPQPTVFLYKARDGKSYVITPTAALPAIARDLGFTPDDVLTKANNPPLFGTGDSFEVSPELLPRVADAPTAVYVPIGTQPLAEIQADPVYARLPAFSSGQVDEVPSTSFRPDYQGAMSTLDTFATQFR